MKETREVRHSDCHCESDRNNPVSAVLKRAYSHSIAAMHGGRASDQPNIYACVLSADGGRVLVSALTLEQEVRNQLTARQAGAVATAASGQDRLPWHAAWRRKGGCGGGSSWWVRPLRSSLPHGRSGRSPMRRAKAGLKI